MRKNITIWEIVTCDSGGCGRYPTNRFFDDEKLAESKLKEYGGYGWVDQPKPGYITEDGSYYLVNTVRDGLPDELVFLENDDSKLKLKNALKKLTEEEIFLIRNS